MVNKEELLQELYDALNTDTADLIMAASGGVTSTSQLRSNNCTDLANKWLKEIKVKNPEFKLINKKKVKE